MLLGEIPLRLADTAGIRDTEDRVEQIGVRMALDRVKTAQFVLAVFDASEELNDDDRALMDAIGDTPAVAVINNPTSRRRSTVRRSISISKRS